MNPVLAALETIIQPAINYAESKLASIGAAFAAGLAVIAVGFTNDQRAIFANVIAFWQAKYKAAAATGISTLDAVEQATTAALNEFCSEEGAEGTKEIQAILTLLESSVKNAFVD
jgi:hypothetical protein